MSDFTLTRRDAMRGAAAAAGAALLPAGARAQEVIDRINFL